MQVKNRLKVTKEDRVEQLLISKRNFSLNFNSLYVVTIFVCCICKYITRSIYYAQLSHLLFFPLTEWIRLAKTTSIIRLHLQLGPHKSRKQSQICCTVVKYHALIKFLRKIVKWKLAKVKYFIVLSVGSSVWVMSDVSDLFCEVAICRWIILILFCWSFYSILFEVWPWFLYETLLSIIVSVSTWCLCLTLPMA